MKQTELNEKFCTYVQQIRDAGVMYKEIYKKLGISNQHFSNLKKKKVNRL